MPRPCKRRRVCGVPALARFGPVCASEGARPEISMTVDEFESIRQIDLEGLTQEECAARMNVARTTAQAIYLSARKKLARCLVEGAELAIGGGEFDVCGGGCCPRCRRKSLNEKGDAAVMKIAVTYENGQVFQHFGHTESFKIYEIEDGKVLSSEVVATNGSGHGALAGFLADRGISALICGGIGGGARVALAQAGIELFPGVAGDADEAAAALAAGELKFDPDTVCAHHQHDDGHDCGDHGCGNHGCHH